MSEVKDLKVILADARAEYEAARGRGMGVGPTKERLKNLLFNNLNEILSMLAENEKLRGEVEMLELSLASADEELDALRKQPPEKKKAKSAMAGE